MKIIRKSDSRVRWYLSCLRSGHIRSVFGSLRSSVKRSSVKRSSVKRSANAKLIQTTITRLAEVSAIDLASSIGGSLNVPYETGFIFRGSDQAVINDVGHVNQVLESAFVALANRDPNFKLQLEAYISNGRAFNLSVYFVRESPKNYLVPTFNGVGMTNLKSEFSSSVETQGVIISPPVRSRATIDEVETMLKSVNNAEEIAQMVNAAGYIVGRGVVKIGSLGSRFTNWDTSYNLHIAGVPRDMLLKMLTFFTDISNEDVSNLVKKNSFDLTQAKEVGGLMDRIGLGGIFAKEVTAIKDFEEAKGLKRIYDLHRRIPDYKKKTMIREIDLSEHRDQALLALIGKVTKNPSYVQILAANGVFDPEELIEVSFTMGEKGELLSFEEATELLEAAA